VNAKDNVEKLVNAEELSKVLSLPPASIRRLAREGRLEYFRCGRLMRFDAQAVLAAMRQDGNKGEEGRDD
jgi:excisionase family DNA binding protein